MNKISTHRITAIGLMSGTSADGIDVALVRIAGSGKDMEVEVIASETFPYPPEVREIILKISEPKEATSDIVAAANVLLGELFADAAQSIILSAGLTNKDVDIIASHGQTIRHDPSGRVIAGRLTGATMQIGEPSVIAVRTGITTIADFRQADMAAGGQGAPLVPYADFVLFGRARLNRAVHNIGGIANVTWLKANGEIGDVIAFDTGPGNMLIDAAAERFLDAACDLDGETASRGRVNQTMLYKMLCHPFFAVPPPKSAGRELFGNDFLDWILADFETRLNTVDLMATLTAFTAHSIADQYRRWLPEMPDEVIIGGGGAHNRTLMHMLGENLSPAKIVTHEDYKIPGDAKEAIAFAILGSETIRGVPSNVPSATGASQPVVLGKICPG